MDEMRNSHGEPGWEWLERQFEFEHCYECGGDTREHAAVMVGGNWSARCKVQANGHAGNIAAMAAGEGEGPKR